MKIKYNYIVAQPSLHKEGFVSCHDCCFRKFDCLTISGLECAYNVTYKRLESEIFDL